MFWKVHIDEMIEVTSLANRSYIPASGKSWLSTRSCTFRQPLSHLSFESHDNIFGKLTRLAPAPTVFGALAIAKRLLKRYENMDVSWARDAGVESHALLVRNNFHYGMQRVLHGHVKSNFWMFCFRCAMPSQLDARSPGSLPALHISHGVIFAP
jgi:hypothetical protein